MKRHNLYSLSIILLFSILLGCRINKQYTPTSPANGSTFTNSNSDTTCFANTKWWNLFNDSTLTSLIEEGISNNIPLQTIIVGIKQSQLQLQITRSQLYPSLNYGVAGESSNNSIFPSNQNTLSVVGQISYTLDVWGRIANQNEAALQAYLATEMAAFEVKATMVAQIAELYFTLRDIDNKLIVAEQMENSLAEFKSVIDTRYEGGFIAKVDVNQLTINLKEIQITLQALKRARKQIENSFSLLLGSEPKNIKRGKKLQDQLFPSELPVGVPSGLLRRRPSIIRSELALKAQLANLNATKTLRYPNFQIDFNLGAQLLSPTATFSSLMANLAGPIFNANRIDNTITIQEEQFNIALLEYRQAYLTALQEVEDALIGITTFQEEVKIRTEQLKLAEEAFDLAWIRYNEGATSLLEFLNVQNALFGAQLTASESYKSQLQSVVKLYLALGGGW